MQLNIHDLSVTYFNIGTSWFPNFSGVRVTYTPTGQFAECGEFKSRHKNQAQALTKLFTPKQMEFDFAN